MRDINANMSGQLRGQSEGPMDPAIGLKHFLRNTINNALDRITKVLFARLEDASDDQKHECELVM